MKMLHFFALAAVLALFSSASRVATSAGRNATAPPPPTDDSQLAPTPPMGWNSWDSYGTTIKEDDFKANASWLAEHLKSYGWQYAVVDMEWFVTNPTAEGNSKNSQFSMDGNGRYIPAPNRFASSANGASFKPLADYTHALGLKFGIHILAGIPKQAAQRNLPIADSSYHAADAADTSATCSWNPDNYGLNPANPAAQAYYDSIAQLYAGWGVDLIKADCIASGPYKGDEIRMLSLALRKTGRPIALSLSPGPAPLEKIGEMRKHAQMWRISSDIWDVWHSTVAYPQGVRDQFPRVAKWAGLGQAGRWPDADMLPLGYLGPAPGWGKPRQTALTHDEQRTLLTLWCMFRSPLMMGGNLPSSDAWTTSLLSNREVIEIDQHSSGNRPVISTDSTVVWLAHAAAENTYYVAVFNVEDASETVRYEFKDLGLDGATYQLRDLWDQKDLGPASAITTTIPSHGTVLYRVSPL